MREKQRGIATWLAPVLGVLICIILYLYQARIEQQDPDVLFIVLFAALGGVAGLVVCVLDKFRDRKAAAETDSDDIAAPKPKDPGPSAARKAIGGAFVAVSIFSMMIGRFFLAVFYPDFSKGGLDSAKLQIFLPIWTIGIIGLILWLWPAKSRDDSRDEAESGNS